MNEKTVIIETYEDYKTRYFETEQKEQEVIDGKKVAQLSLQKIAQLVNLKKSS